MAFLKIPGHPIPPAPPTLVKLGEPKPCGQQRTGVLRNALRAFWNRVPISDLIFFPEKSGGADGQVLQSPNSASPSSSLCVWRLRSLGRGVGAFPTTRHCKESLSGRSRPPPHSPAGREAPPG